jgi:uncharacterized membrane protein
MKSVVLALIQLVGFVVAPPRLLLGTIVAWFLLARLVGLRNTIRQSVQISRIRYRQPLRSIISNAPGCVLILSVSIIALFSWLLQSDPNQLRFVMTASAVGASWRLFRTASNPALSTMLLAMAYVVCISSSEIVFFWTVSILLGLIGCGAVFSTLPTV